MEVKTKGVNRGSEHHELEEQVDGGLRRLRHGGVEVFDVAAARITIHNHGAHLEMRESLRFRYIFSSTFVFYYLARLFVCTFQILPKLHLKTQKI